MTKHGTSVSILFSKGYVCDYCDKTFKCMRNLKFYVNIIKLHYNINHPEINFEEIKIDKLTKTRIVRR